MKRRVKRRATSRRHGGHLHACRGAVGSTWQVGFVPVNEDDGGRGAREHKGILHRCVPAAHDDDRFAAVQEAIAGGAGGDASALEVVLAGHT